MSIGVIISSHFWKQLTLVVYITYVVNSQSLRSVLDRLIYRFYGHSIFFYNFFCRAFLLSFSYLSPFLCCLVIKVFLYISLFLFLHKLRSLLFFFLFPIFYFFLYLSMLNFYSFPHRQLNSLQFFLVLFCLSQLITMQYHTPRKTFYQSISFVTKSFLCFTNFVATSQILGNVILLIFISNYLQVFFRSCSILANSFDFTFSIPHVSSYFAQWGQ